MLHNICYDAAAYRSARKSSVAGRSSGKVSSHRGTLARCGRVELYCGRYNLRKAPCCGISDGKLAKWYSRRSQYRDDSKSQFAV
jgi:hypothetical protein